MARSSAAPKFSFISYQDSTQPDNAAVRAVIRRHATRNIAATRRRRNNYGHNRRQHEIIYRNHEISLGDPNSISEVSVLHDNQNYEHVVLYSLPTRHCEFEIHNCLSRMDLIAPIAGLPLGIATLSRFAISDNLVGDGFRAPLPFSKLDSRQLHVFIPARYKVVCSITHAANCLVARIEQMMALNACTGKEELTILQHYTDALRSLQEALDDDAQRMAPETLCAAELLGLFELLSGRPEQQAWARHVAGTAQLIKLRGPHRFQTDFELALFMAHVGPMVVEAFLHNKTCFIVEEHWQNVMRAAIHNDPSIPAEQRNLVYELWRHIVAGPNIFIQVADLILSPTPPSEGDIEYAIESLQRDQAHLKVWLGLARDLELVGNAAERHGNFFSPSVWSRSACADAPDPPLCPILHGTFLMCYILKARLLSSISPSRFCSAEAECQALAHEILCLQEDQSVRDDGGIMARLFLTQTVQIAGAIRDTQDLWKANTIERTTDCGSRRTTIETWKFENWCARMRGEH
ncbi:hypothetical protein V8C35DRAFT_305066 [Trichoderma chlorosporum]